MKLLLLTLLTCKNPDCATDPRVLRVFLQAGELDESRPAPGLLAEAVERVGYEAILQVAQDCELTDVGLPQTLPPMWRRDSGLMAALHELLLNREIVEGTLTCPTCGCVYRVSGGVPVMRAAAGGEEGG